MQLGNEEGDEAGASRNESRLLSTLEQLLAIESTELEPALAQVSDLLADALSADKIDTFLYDPPTHSLVAFGTSHTLMGRHQKQLGLDRLPVVGGGRTVQVFQTGQVFLTGRADQDLQVLPGIKGAMEARSMMLVPLVVAGERRGVLAAASAREDLFTDGDLRFFEAAARWVGTLTHRAELVQSTQRHAIEEARRVTAEELVTVLAHDLGNRLTPAIGRVDMLRRYARRDGNDKYLQAAQAAYDALAQVNDLIKDLLDVSRLERGLFALAPSRVDLAALARETASLLHSNQASIQQRLPDELWVDADPDRVRQALENLLANAVKHSPKGQAVTLQLDAERRGDAGSPPGREWAVFTVHDEGPGIPPEILPRLFMPFVSGPNSTGLGIGLFLAHEIAHAHGGTLEVESAPGAGTTFCLSLPANRTS